MHRLLNSAIICFLVFGATAFAQTRVPKFADYPARVLPIRRSAKLQLHSTPYTACFRTMLRKTARVGQRFAGHYALWYWGCGTCLRVGIVDLITGRTYVSPFQVSTAQGVYNVMPNSRLVIVNDPEVDSTGYFLWNGRHFLPIYNGRVERREPEREFNACSEVPRYTANERALIGRVVEKQSGYTTVGETRRAFADEAARAETIIERKDDQLIATFVLPQGRFYSVVRVANTQLYQTYAHSLDDALAFEKLRKRKR